MLSIILYWTASGRKYVLFKCTIHWNLQLRSLSRLRIRHVGLNYGAKNSVHRIIFIPIYCSPDNKIILISLEKKNLLNYVIFTIEKDFKLWRSLYITKRVQFRFSVTGYSLHVVWCHIIVCDTQILHKFRR